LKYIIGSLYQALKLILSFDVEVYKIIGLSLIVTVVSTCIASIFGVTLGVFAGSTDFKGKRLFTRFVNTFMGLPPVVAGLIVYLMLSRKGPFGQLQLLFTPAAMVIAQVIIVFPIVCGLTISAVRLKRKLVLETCKGLGFTRLKSLSILIHECRYPIVSVLLAGYGRAISEVGAVMLVGGNIQNSTRVMTTAIVLETGKGNYDRALALGVLLLTISFCINWIVQKFQEGI
jgi:tungstate transport system permease protein